MCYSATITDPHEADAMPMWESVDHAEFADALQAAQAYIHATQRPQTASSRKDRASTESGPACRPRHELPPSSSSRAPAG